ncbi:MAG: adenine methyltransferase [Spirochaetaceae bacterium]|nr:MAG: adenine methyltransferase [Spirochaetaceae bacterium]
MNRTAGRKQSQSFLHHALIPYLGNKRRLLPALEQVFSRFEPAERPTAFADPFAGSGAVTRLARSRGYRITASDIEPYAAILIRAHAGISPGRAADLFRDYGGLGEAIRHLNDIGATATIDPTRRGYIASNFAPERTDAPKIGFERLFYTAENARFIDAVRDEISRLVASVPPADVPDFEALLLAPLLVEAAVHVNTSGVFKAYHRGFGGHGRDALKRIMAAMELEVPLLEDGPDARIARCDAVKLFQDLPEQSSFFDLVYLDPPYNSHQYGSNYFMLNTIARWDRPAVSSDTDSDGVLLHKAGIRSDWKETRSAFCSSRTAPGAFSELFSSIHAETIVLSYNTEGIVPFDLLCELMAEKGSLSLETLEYTQYRGGRQSADRKNHTTEILLISSRSGHSRYTGAIPLKDARADSVRVEHALRIQAFARSRFVPARVSTVFGCPDALVSVGDGSLQWRQGYCVTVDASLKDLVRASTERLSELRAQLETCVCTDNTEELSVLLHLIPVADSRGELSKKRLEQRYLTLLRKLAHPRYVDEYRTCLRLFVNMRGKSERCVKELEKLAELTKSRLGDAAEAATPHEKET